MEILSYYTPLTIYIFGIIVALLTILVKTEIGLVYLVLFLPLQNILQKIQAFPFGNQFVDILVLSVIIGWLFRGRSENGKIFVRTSLNLPIFLYIIIMYISLWWGSFNLGIDLPTSLSNPRLQDWKNLVLLPILYFITVNNIKDQKWMKIIMVVALFSIFLTDVFFFREFRWVKQWHYTHDMRVSGPFSYLGPNELGAFFAQYGLLVIGLFLFAKRRLERILFGLISIFTFYCLMYSFSRAGYFAFPIGLAFLLFFKSKKLLIAFIILLFLSPALLPQSVMERIQMSTLSEEQKAEIEMSQSEKQGLYSNATPMFDPSAQGRFELWKDALKLFTGSPILGVGFRNYRLIRGLDTHNNFFKTLAEGGIIGFFIYIYLYYLAFKSGWQLYRKSEEQHLKGLGLGFAACVIANIICNFTHDNWTYLNLMGLYWVVLALVVRVRIMMEKNILANA